MINERRKYSEYIKNNIKQIIEKIYKTFILNKNNEVNNDYLELNTYYNVTKMHLSYIENSINKLKTNYNDVAEQDTLIIERVNLILSFYLAITSIVKFINKNNKKMNFLLRVWAH